MLIEISRESNQRSAMRIKTKNIIRIDVWFPNFVHKYFETILISIINK